MKWEALIYGSTTGNTEEVAETIAKSLDISEVHDVAKGDFSEVLEKYNYIVIGTPTLGSGDLQDDWEDIEDEVRSASFEGKTIALFGLGDQAGYGDTFVDALGTLYKIITSAGGKVVGFTSTDGYDFEESTAIEDGSFVGLVLDQDNQDNLTDQRIEKWTKELLSL